MTAQELRIGNLVNLCFEHKPGWFIASVTNIYDNNTIDTDSVYVVNKVKYYFEGVPLTEYWLLMFGFEDRVGLWVLTKELPNTMIIIHQTLNGFSFSWSDANDRMILKIQFVHQLQNLYFALTSEELSLTDKPKEG